MSDPSSSLPASDPDRWGRIQALFHQATELPPAERADFLDAECDDPALRAEVESLLQAHEEAGDFLQGAADDLFAAAADEPPSIGPYRLLEPIGQGGMGLVYRAERSDGLYEREVALKIIRSGLDRETLERRFEAERHALARLEHPNIARLYDAGIDDAGRPYVVMEYVDGAPIDQYCDAHRLGLDERMDLFEQVGDAMHYAHQNLVLHRDLKPSNILVTEAGQVKLLDFGLAKLLEPDEPTEQTQTRHRVLTPQYASPEQIRGEALSTASDVYSLGVVLYQLLTGRRPHGSTTTSPYELERFVVEEPPVRPSAAVTQPLEEEDVATPEILARRRGLSPETLRDRLQGDLDTILMQALRKSPEARYRSAEQLVDDLRRHRTDRPVTARTPTWHYRLSRFMRRHHTAVTATLVGMACLIIGGSVAVWQAVEAAQERDAAEQAEMRTAETLDFLMGLIDQANPTAADGEEITVHEVADEAFEELREAPPNDATLQVHMAGTIGELYSNLGYFEASEEALSMALSTGEEAFGPNHPEIANLLAERAKLYYRTSQYDAGLEAVEQAEEILTNNDVDPLDPLWDEVYDMQGALADRQGNYERSEEAYRQLRALREAQYGPDHPQTATTLVRIASSYQTRQDPSTAETYYRDGLSVLEDHYSEPNRNLAQTRSMLSTTLNSRAQNLLEEGDSAEAQAYFEEATDLLYAAIDDFEALYGPEHPESIGTYSELAGVYRRKGDLEQAEALYRETLDRQRDALPPGHARLAWTLNGLGHALSDQGDPEAALPYFEEALDIIQANMPPESPLLATARLATASTLVDLDRHAEAESLYVQAYGDFRQGHPFTYERTHDLRQTIADFYDAWDRPAQAMAYRWTLTENMHE